MIVRQMEDSIRLITQHDHARAAGTIVRHWAGVDLIPPPPPEIKGPVWFAVDNHDVGWCKIDESPLYDPETRLPFSFFGITSDEITEIWSESIVTCADFHVFSGYLVSVHFGQLAEAGCRGAPPGALSRLKEFDRSQTRRQAEWMKEFSPVEMEMREKATLLLRACDTLSLLTCRAPEISPPAGQIHPLTRCGLNVRPTEEGGLEISPWPLDTDCLELRFPGLTIPGKRFESAEDMKDALERAEPGVFVSRVTPLS
ncbi:MAG: DUF3891 family protein [Nitrospinota bacterium]